MKHTHIVKRHCLSHINVRILGYTHTYKHYRYKNNFKEVKIPSTTNRLTFITRIIMPAIMLVC
jgi:hypothetical protein